VFSLFSFLFILQIKDLNEYALLVADTVVITKTSADVMTKHNKSLSDISYTIHDTAKSDDDDDDDDDDESVDAPEAPKGDAELARKISTEVNLNQRSSKRLAAGYDAQVDIQANAAEREKRQIKLMQRRNEDRIRELARAKSRGKDGNKENEGAEEIEVYKKTVDYPDNVLPNQIKVDMPNKCVLLPIGGNPVPFHISTIKAATPQNLDNVHYLRLTFYSAGTSLGKEASKNIGKLVEKYSPYASFIREMTFRSLDGQNLNNAYRMIMELRKRFRAQEIQEEEEATLVKQDKLIRTKNERVPRLSDLTLMVFVSYPIVENLSISSTLISNMPFFNHVKTKLWF
jgi:nucleosome binding factor SPN SPT16 subunit